MNKLLTVLTASMTMTEPTLPLPLDELRKLVEHGRSESPGPSHGSARRRRTSTSTPGLSGEVGAIMLHLEAQAGLILKIRHHLRGAPPSRSLP